MISQMVSGTKPVRRFPAVYRHYSPTVARRLVRTPDERIRVDPSAAARGVCHLAVVHSRKHSGSDGNPPDPGADPRRAGGPNMESADSTIIVHLSTFDHMGCEHHHGQQFRSVQSCYFLMCFPGDASAIPCPPGGTRRTLFGASGRGRTAVFPVRLPFPAVAAGARDSVAVRPRGPVAD